LVLLPDYGVRFAMDIEIAPKELLLEDLEASEKLKRMIAARLSRSVHEIRIARFLTADGEPIAPGGGLLEQLPENNQTVMVILEEDEIGANASIPQEMGLGV
jgi:hypothetical protein